MNHWLQGQRRLATLFLILGLWLGLNIAPVYALGGPQLPLDQPAPVFELPSNTGDGDVSLDDYRGQWVVLYFYPRAIRSLQTVFAFA